MLSQRTLQRLFTLAAVFLFPFQAWAARPSHGAVDTLVFHPPAIQPTVRININGFDHHGVDFPGFWKGDPGHGGVCHGNFFHNYDEIYGTRDDALFQGEVYGNPAVCRIDNYGQRLPRGTYRVNLYFSEI